VAAWYEKTGLRFECQPGCGACCTSHGEYAHVWLDGDDAERLAAHLGLSLEELRTRYVETDPEIGRERLRGDGPDCTFLEGARCSVYAARPVQCRTFPFWSANLESRRTWVALCEFCPGIDRGRLHGADEIRDHVDARRRASRRGATGRGS
jgi:Fe-S-cluster containining protein